VANAGLQTKITEEFHSSLIGGYSGVQASYPMPNKLFPFYWNQAGSAKLCAAVPTLLAGQT
jgi:hypothetical protein